MNAGKKPVIRPCRGIGLTATHSLIVQIWGLEQTNFAADPHAIKRTDVAALLDSARVPYGTDELDKLADALNILRVTVPASEALSFDPLARVGPAFAILSEDLPLMIDLARNPPFNSRPRPVEAAALRRVLDAVHRANRFVQNVPGRRGGKPWHDDAMWLAFLLRTAAYLRGHPEDVVLTSATGNGVQFIRAALERACQLNLTGDAIVKAVRRYAEGKIPGITVSS